MLIFCCGMPRSGGTLLYQLVKEIAETGGVCKGRGFPKERYRNGVVKTDTCQPWMIKRIKKGALAFGTYRDFRDIIVSLRTFYTRRAFARYDRKKWTVDDVLAYRSNILDVYYCWQPHATWFKYEDVGLIRTIIDTASNALSVRLSFEQKRDMVSWYSLEANEKRIKNQSVWMDAGSGSMLTKIHISSTRGRSTWEEALSKEDLAKVEAIGGDWLKEHGYK